MARIGEADPAIVQAPAPGEAQGVNPADFSRLQQMAQSGDVPLVDMATVHSDPALGASFDAIRAEANGADSPNAARTMSMIDRFRPFARTRQILD